MLILSHPAPEILLKANPNPRASARPCVALPGGVGHPGPRSADGLWTLQGRSATLRRVGEDRGGRSETTGDDPIPGEDRRQTNTRDRGS